jgi:hypothetical protein
MSTVMSTVMIRLNDAVVYSDECTDEYTRNSDESDEYMMGVKSTVRSTVMSTFKFC